MTIKAFHKTRLGKEKQADCASAPVGNGSYPFRFDNSHTPLLGGTVTDRSLRCVCESDERCEMHRLSFSKLMTMNFFQSIARLKYGLFSFNPFCTALGSVLFSGRVITYLFLLNILLSSETAAAMSSPHSSFI